MLVVVAGNDIDRLCERIDGVIGFHVQRLLSGGGSGEAWIAKENRSAAGVHSGFDVARRIADYPAVRQIQIEVASGRYDHPAAGLAAIALLSIRLDRCFGMKGAELVAIDDGVCVLITK